MDTLWKLPNGNINVRVEFIESESSDKGEEDNKPNYSDVSKDTWYKDAVDYVSGNGIMTGYNGKFDPNGKLTRAMAVNTLWRLEGRPKANYELTYKDIDPNGWYIPSLEWGTRDEIVYGYSDEAFGPNDSLTHEQLFAIGYRYYCSKVDAVALGSVQLYAQFKDYTDIDNYALTAMDWAIDNELVHGFEDDTLRPNAPITRAEMATFIMNINTKLLNK